MDSSELGRRIKEARIKKKMTQAELVGDFITRNMLSQIENGNAMPSVQTLEYLAERLDLPVASLVPEEGDSPEKQLAASKTALSEGRYSDAADAARLCEIVFPDECAAISAMAYYGIGKQNEEKGDFVAAAQMYSRACSLSDKGIYANRQRKSDAALALLRVTQEITK